MTTILHCRLTPIQAIEQLTGVTLTKAEAAHLVCPECGRPLCSTAAGSWCCGAGHWRLIRQSTLIARLTGMNEEWLMRDADFLKGALEDHAQQFARAHRYITPLRLLRELKLAMQQRRCAVCLLSERDSTGHGSLKPALEWAGPELCRGCAEESAAPKRARKKAKGA